MSKRYFLNNFDSFLGKAIMRELVKEEDEEEGNIMGTSINPDRLDKPKGIKKILKVY